MTEKRFQIVDEQFISYYGGTGHKISNGGCGFWLWHNKTESQKVCDRLNNMLDENEQLKKALRELLEEYGNSYYIDLFDKLFNLEYREWYNPTAPNNEPYVDWEKIVKEKELEE